MFLLDGNFLVVAGGIYELVQFFLKIWLEIVLLHMHGVHSVFFFCWKFLAWGWWNFELVQSFLETRFEIVLLGTHGVHCLFSFVMEISCWTQLEFWACSNNVRYTQCARSVFLREGKFFVRAGVILSLSTFSWKSDWSLFCYARLVSTVCFLSWWKFRA